MALPRISLILAAPYDLAQQPFGFFLNGQNVGADLFERAQRLRLVEVPREADLVADLGGVFLDPGIGRVGQHLAADEGLDAAVFEQRNLLGVAQIGVGLVFDVRVSCRLRASRSGHARVGRRLARLVDLGDDGRRGLDAPTYGTRMSFRSAAESLIASFLSAASTRSRKTL